MRKIILAGLMAATAIAPLSPALAQVQFAQRDHDRRGNNHADRQQSRGENRAERQERRVERSQTRPNVRSESRNARSVERQDNRGPERNWRDSRDRKSVGEGKSGYVRVDLGGRRIIKKKKNKNTK